MRVPGMQARRLMPAWLWIVLSLLTAGAALTAITATWASRRRDEDHGGEGTT